MRTLDAGLVTAIEQDATTPLTLIEIMTPTPLRVARASVSAVGRSFTAASVQASINGSGGSVRVFNENGTLGSTVISEGVAGARCRIWQTYITDTLDDAENLLLTPDNFGSVSWTTGSALTIDTGAPIGWTRLDSGVGLSRIWQNVVVPTAEATYTVRVSVRKNSNDNGFPFGTCGFSVRSRNGSTAEDSFPDFLFDANAGTSVSGSFDIDSSGDAWLLTKEFLKDDGDDNLAITIFPWTNNIITTSVNGSTQGHTDWRTPLIRLGAADNGIEFPTLIFEGLVTSATVGEYVDYSLSQFSPRQTPYRRITEQDYPQIGTVGALNREV